MKKKENRVRIEQRKSVTIYNKIYLKTSRDMGMTARRQWKVEEKYGKKYLIATLIFPKKCKGNRL